VIQTVRVHNLAVIDDVELELGPGLNVLTGETGTGKSVLLAAIALLRGERVGSEVIRTGCDEARVEALMQSSALVARARERGLADESDDELLIVRTISQTGRGRCFVNGSLATQTLLAELLGEEIEVTSQGAHLRLLRPDVQTDVLDRFAGLQDAVSEIAQGVRDWRGLALELQERRAQSEERARREDQLAFELEQIEQAQLSAGEEDELSLRHSRLAHVERLGSATAATAEGLDGEGGVRERLARARAELGEALDLDAALAEPLAGLERAEVELAEAARALEHYASRLEADPEALARVEARLGEIGRLKSRYGSSVDDVLAYRERALAELERIGGGEARTAELEKKLEARAAELDTAAGRLEKARRQAGLDLADAVNKELRGLGFGRSAFRVAFEPLSAKTVEGFEAPCAARGRERAGFELVANPGEAARRLRDAASGGELARLLLALRNVLRDTERGGVLLFDEVDAGIGGRVARRVGERLAALAKSHQILCITHLAPIAALGDVHLRVDKRVRGGRTRTTVRDLRDELRVDEIARMSGTGAITDAARAHARELLSH
jgi:DNA repair protein RecN (Recombination protein N)